MIKSLHANSLYQSPFRHFSIHSGIGRKGELRSVGTKAWKTGGDAGYRDRPLTFQWQSPLGLVRALGLSATRNGAYEATRRAILAEALLGAESGQGVSYSRRKVFYSSGKRYRAPLHTYATVLRSVEELEQAEWLLGHRVKPNNRGWQSSFWATPDLIQAAREFVADLTYEVREPIRLKDDADELLDYPETRETLRIRRALEPINDPGQAPGGDQIDLMEVMEIEHGLIQHHRIYWG